MYLTQLSTRKVSFHHHHHFTIKEEGAILARPAYFALRCRPLWQPVCTRRHPRCPNFVATSNKWNDGYTQQCLGHRQYPAKEQIISNSKWKDGCTQKCSGDSQHPPKEQALSLRLWKSSWSTSLTPHYLHITPRHHLVTTWVHRLPPTAFAFRLVRARALRVLASEDWKRLVLPAFLRRRSPIKAWMYAASAFVL